MTEQDMLTVEELACIMDGCAAFYRFSSNALLHEFTKEQIAELKEMGVPEDASPAARDAFGAIKRYLAHCGADPRTDLAVDYARVFLSAGVYDGLTAEPYESVFTSEDQLLMQDSRDDAVRIYRQQGIEVDPELHMPEDHLGLELDFIATMASRTAALLREANQGEGGGSSEGGATNNAEPDYSAVAEAARVQADFIEQHILNWIDALIEKVDEFSKLPLYPALMRIIKDQAAQDLVLMREVEAAVS